MAVGSVQAVGHGMTKPQRWLVIDSAKFARWLVRHLWGYRQEVNFLADCLPNDRPEAAAVMHFRVTCSVGQ